MVASLVVSQPLWAAEADVSTAKPQAAQIVTLARLGSVLCPDLDVDEQAVQALMGKAGIAERDIVDPAAFGPHDTDVARSFAQSFMADPATSCTRLFGALGPGEGQLLKRGGRPI